jgi:hypothetical protein
MRSIGGALLSRRRIEIFAIASIGKQSRTGYPAIPRIFFFFFFLFIGIVRFGKRNAVFDSEDETYAEFGFTFGGFGGRWG